MTQRGYRWHQATVYKVENGERQIQLSEAREIANIFEVALDQMLQMPEDASVARRGTRPRHQLVLLLVRPDRLASHRPRASADVLRKSVEAAKNLAKTRCWPGIEKVRRAEDLLKLTAEESFEVGRTVTNPQA